MKRTLAFLVIILAPVIVFAAPPVGPWSLGFSKNWPPEAGPYLLAEILQIKSEMGQQKLGDIDGATLASIRERLSIASQKEDYVREMAMHSLALPGLDSSRWVTPPAASGSWRLILLS